MEVVGIAHSAVDHSGGLIDVGVVLQYECASWSGRPATVSCLCGSSPLPANTAFSLPQILCPAPSTRPTRMPTYSTIGLLCCCRQN
jgi:hypothetical protein